MSTADEIPVISYVAEPLVVASILLTGCWANRNRSSPCANASTMTALKPDRLPFFLWSMRVPETTVYASRAISRFLSNFPFTMELIYWLLTYWIYQISRATQALTMGEGTWAVAQQHGEWIVWLERVTLADIELPVQHFVMARPVLMYLCNKIYSMVHIPATTAFIGYAYYSFHPTVFQQTRRTLVLCNGLAFVIFSLWPCMPPRLLPYDQYGFVDTVHRHAAASIWTTNKFQNQLAAFPSLHFGYSFVIGLSLWYYSPHRVLRFLGAIYPVMILAIIMATANHYLVDALGGAVVTYIAHHYNRILLNLRPIEEWAFWMCATDKPVDKDALQRSQSERDLEKWADYPLLQDISPLMSDA